MFLLLLLHTQDFTTDFYFRQAWHDSRLSFKPLPGINELVVGAEVAEKIWVPDTFFANEKSAYFHIATTRNTFLRIGSNGAIFRSIRLTVTASCPMDLQYFPMDSQLCSIDIESYGYSMSDIRYTWRKGNKSVALADSLSLPQFKVVGHRQLQKVIELSTGNYSRLVAQIQFARSLGFYLIQIYVPASLIVVISWVSFWLHRNATPARVALGVTTVLTMTTLISSTNAQLPKISYIKSIDVYLGTCFVMVFASLLEYATVGYLGKRIAMRKSRCQQLAKLAEQHRQKCSAAAAAAAVIVQQQQSTHHNNHHHHSGYTASLTAPNTPSIQRASPFLLSSCMQEPGSMSIIRTMPSSTLPPPTQSACSPALSMRTPLIKRDNLHTNITNGDRDRGQSVSFAPFHSSISHHASMHHLNQFSSASSSRCESMENIYTTHATNSGQQATTIYLHTPINNNTPGNTGNSYCITPATSKGSTAAAAAALTHRSSFTSSTNGNGNDHRSTTIVIPCNSSNQLTTTVTTTSAPSNGNNSTDVNLPSTKSTTGPTSAPTTSENNATTGDTDATGSFLPIFSKNLNKMFGVSSSDIDKYSRVVFPVCFVCFNLMYWIIYMHIR